jgi:hypothetical protein
MMKGNESLQLIRRKLADAGLLLLDTTWRGQSGQYRFRCESGHVSSQWGSSLMRVVRDQRGALKCRQCWIGHTMTRVHEIARQSGGQCLTTEYGGLDGRYAFVCAVGHTFETTAAIILGGSWCPACSNMRNAERRRTAGGLLPIQQRARERGGECLSTVYNGRTAKYRFRCAQGHEWEAAGIEIMRKAWCQQCVFERARRPDGLAALHRAAESRGGTCLASRYQRIQTRYPFRCGREHEWMAWGSEILKGGWCPTCRTEDRRRQGIESMRVIAAERGGQCVSNTYVDNNTKLEWECARGHRWWARPRQITMGNWCAQCHFLSQITNEKTRRKRTHEAVRLVG